MPRELAAVSIHFVFHSRVLSQTLLRPLQLYMAEEWCAVGRPYKVRRICEMTRVHTGSCRTRFVRSATDGKKKKADAVPIDNRAGTTRVVGAFFFRTVATCGRAANGRD